MKNQIDCTTFIPTNDWRAVPNGAVLPPGCEIRMSMSIEGSVEARWQQPKAKPPALPAWRRLLAWWRR